MTDKGDDLVHIKCSLGLVVCQDAAVLFIRQ